MALTATSWHLRQMHTGDIVHAERIRQRVGWNQTPADWQRLIALHLDGCFVAEVAGIPVGTVTTIRYASRLAWIGMLLVHPGQRNQGIGSALLQRAIGYLREAGIDSIALDATPAGQPLYTRAGFSPVWELGRWQGHFPCRALASSSHIQTAISQEAWPSILELDARSFGVVRPALLHALVIQSKRVALAVDGAAGLLGFGMLRSGTHAHMLGPLVASNGEIAADLLATLWARWSSGSIFWDIPEPNRTAIQLAESLGFTRQRLLTRMVYGAAYPSHDPQLLYAVADLATG